MTDRIKNIQTAISALNEAGQSVWCDNLSREILNNGELQQLINAGVSGLTSNPAIFKKAIADSNLYDAALVPLKAQGLTVEEATESLMIDDVARAADLFKPVFEQTSAHDGYVSIEVAPDLAHDTEGTIKSALAIWERLNRANIMIKVPATEAGIPAIQALLEHGLNVNITLIFSVDVYAKVVEAYLTALEKRLAAGKPIDKIASVASFFVSRVDAIVEKNLSGREAEAPVRAILGKVGVANSKLAYELYETQFNSARFNKLKERGAKPQRALWASTGVKNTAYSQLLYVEPLAAPNTVNTMPPQTIEALAAGVQVEGKITEYGMAHQIIDSLATLDLPFSKLLNQLQEEGVKLFVDAYSDLLKAVAIKFDGN